MCLSRPQFPDKRVGGPAAKGLCNWCAAAAGTDIAGQMGFALTRERAFSGAGGEGRPALSALCP